MFGFGRVCFVWCSVFLVLIKCGNVSFRSWCLLCSDFLRFYKIFVIFAFLYNTFFPAVSCLDVLTSLFDMFMFLMCFCYQFVVFFNMLSPVVIHTEFLPLRLFCMIF